MIQSRDERIKEAQEEYEKTLSRYKQIEVLYAPLLQDLTKAKQKLEFSKRFKNIGDSIVWVSREGNHNRDEVVHNAIVIGFIEGLNGRNHYEVIHKQDSRKDFVYVCDVIND